MVIVPLVREILPVVGTNGAVAVSSDDVAPVKAKVSEPLPVFTRLEQASFACTMASKAVPAV